jgi:pyridoxamine 5'-phosphate oxidase
MTNKTPTVADMRQDYQKGELLEATANASPFLQFGLWFNEATTAMADSAAWEPNAMTLATVDTTGSPSARIVLLKAFDERGFVFFTNYESRKGQELAAQSKCALLFYWNTLERQVRIEGLVEKVSTQESDEYFQTRPLGSRIGAWASPQSKVIAGRDELEQSQADFEAKFGESPVRPAHWGGYRVVPNYFEFWQGRRSRLHDRLTYVPNNPGWRLQRLAP